jgi:hypothetical protein
LEIKGPKGEDSHSSGEDQAVGEAAEKERAQEIQAKAKEPKE